MDELTPSQFDEWIAYSQLEPFGALKEAEREADLLSVVANLTAETEVESLDVLAAWSYDTGRAADDEVMSEEQTFALVCGAFGVV